MKSDYFYDFSTAATLSWKLETIYLFIIVAYKIIILVITLPQGTQNKSSVKVCKTEQQQLSARIKISTV